MFSPFRVSLSSRTRHRSCPMLVQPYETAGRWECRGGALFLRLSRFSTVSVAARSAPPQRDVPSAFSQRSRFARCSTRRVGSAHRYRPLHTLTSFTRRVALLQRNPLVSRWCRGVLVASPPHSVIIKAARILFARRATAVASSSVRPSDQTPLNATSSAAGTAPCGSRAHGCIVLTVNAVTGGIFPLCACRVACW